MTLDEFFEDLKNTKEEDVEKNTFDLYKKEFPIEYFCTSYTIPIDFIKLPVYKSSELKFKEKVVIATIKDDELMEYDNRPTTITFGSHIHIEDLAEYLKLYYKVWNFKKLLLSSETEKFRKIRWRRKIKLLNEAITWLIQSAPIYYYYDHFYERITIGDIDVVIMYPLTFLPSKELEQSHLS
jgi:hypothetical protein